MHLDDSTFQRVDLAGVSLVRTRTLGNLVQQNRVLGQQVRELQEQNEQHRATIAQINGKLHGLSVKEEEEKERDYQLVMALQGLIAALSDLDPPFKELYELCKAYTMTSVERLYGLYKAVEYICRGQIPGAIVETGVWMGGSMMMAAHTLLRLGDSSRRLFLYDTYEGHPKPDPKVDVDLWGNRAIDDWEKFRVSDQASNWARVSSETVRENMRSTGYPIENVVLVKGMVEQTALPNTPDAIALLRLDTDWFESARVALETFYPRLSDNGVLIVDDYGHYRGQREAVDRYFTDDQAPPLLTRIDYSCRLAIKPARRPRD